MPTELPPHGLCINPRLQKRPLALASAMRGHQRPFSSRFANAKLYDARNRPSSIMEYIYASNRWNCYNRSSLSDIRSLAHRLGLQRRPD
jgi:hypothetical protein